jgi:hypothetical protein
MQLPFKVSMSTLGKMSSNEMAPSDIDNLKKMTLIKLIQLRALK